MKDLVDEVTFNWEVDGEGFLPEKTRQAFCNLFDSTSEDARLVMRHLVLLCGWMDQGHYKDPIEAAQLNSLRGIIYEIKKQLNIEPIEELIEEGE